MLLNDLKTSSHTIKDLIKDPVNRKLLENLAVFADHLGARGYIVTAYSDRSLRKLAELTPEKKQQITQNYELWADWIRPTGETQTSEDTERECLRKALNHYGLCADQSFWKTLEDGQIVEFYGPEMVQLYRSFNFFNITGYSILDISVFEFYVLWHRSKKAIEETINELKDVLHTYIPVKKFQIPGQLIRESYNEGVTEPFVPRAVLAEFQHYGSLRKIVSDGSPSGFICSSRARVIALGDAALNIQFV